MKHRNGLPGRILTFYSFKGGAGRSMALANVACLLARNDGESEKRVMVMDWDFEAPGLHRFFPEKTDLPENKERLGLIDYFIRLRRLLDRDSTLREEICKEEGWGKLNEVHPVDEYLIRDVQPGVDLIKAGKYNGSYAELSETFEWARFFTDHAPAFTAFREMLCNRFHFILIDSRTGFTDTSGICTMLLPEKIIPVFTPNRQSLTGALDFIKQAVEYRNKSNDPRPMAVFPLPSRIDDAEEELRKKWRNDYQERFENLFKELYEIDGIDLTGYFDEVKLPYKSYYAYGEKLAVISERNESHSLHRSYKIFTDRLYGLDMAWGSFEAEISDPYELLAQADTSYSEDKYEEAAFLFNRIREIFQTRNDRRGLMIVLNKLGDIYLNQSKLGDAEEAFQSVYDISKEISDPAGEAEALRGLGDATQLLGKTRTAIEFYERTLSIVREIGDRPKEGHALGKLGDAHVAIGDFQKAMGFDEQRLNIAREIGDKTEEKNALGNLGIAHVSLDKVHKAIEFYEKRLIIVREIADRTGEENTLGHLAIAYASVGENEKAIRLLEQALDISQKIGNRYQERNPIQNIGNVHETIGEVQKAIGFYEKKLGITREIGDSREQGVDHIN